MIPKILLLIKQIRPTASQIDNLRTAIPILLQPRTFEAVEGVRYAFSTADDAFVLVVAEAAFVADADKGRRAHVGVADGAFAVAFVAEAADGYARLLAAHDEIGVVARHGGCFSRARWTTEVYFVAPERCAGFELLGSRT